VTANDAVTDDRGRVMFHCSVCGEAMTRSDFYDAELRLPDRGESAEEYCDAELIDQLEHATCVKRVRSSRAG
jgi:hypothetical protein